MSRGALPHCAWDDHPQTSADAREKGATPAGHGAKSDAVREAAIRALLTEKSIQRAAERCRVNERTLRRWLTEDAAFLAEYDHARQALHRAGMARVQALTGKGVETLEELLDAKEFPAVRSGRPAQSSSSASISTTRRSFCGSSRTWKGRISGAGVDRPCQPGGPFAHVSLD